MKRLLASALIVCALTISACGTEVELGDRPQYRFGTNNLTLFVFDGQTGALLDSASVTLNVAGDIFTAEYTGNAYVINGIPNGSFPVTISANGYLPVTGVQAFASGGDITSPTTQPTFQTFTVAMFPVLSVADDVVIKAYDSTSGTLIAGGEVTARLDTTVTIGSLAGNGTTPFSGSVGFVPNTIKVNMASGTATLPRAQLIYGATYVITITSARNAQNQYLAPSTIAAFKAGTSYPAVVVFMGPPAVDPVALSASNEDGGFHDTLAVNFPYPVVVCSTAADMKWVNAAGTTIAPAPVNPVTATLSNGNTTVTLQYNINGPDNTGEDLTVTFQFVKVRVSGGSTCKALETVSLRGGATNVSPTIKVRDV